MTPVLRERTSLTPMIVVSAYMKYVRRGLRKQIDQLREEGREVFEIDSYGFEGTEDAKLKRWARGGGSFFLHRCCITPLVAFSIGRYRKNCASNQMGLLTFDSANITAIVQGMSKGRGFDECKQKSAEGLWRGIFVCR